MRSLAALALLRVRLVDGAEEPKEANTRFNPTKDNQRLISIPSSHPFTDLIIQDWLTLVQISLQF